MSSEEHEQILAEELEVLESIYVDELEKISQDELRIRVDPEEGAPSAEGEEAVSLYLHIKYTPSYPDEPPGMSISLLSGEVSDAGLQQLQAGLDEVAQDSLGMAMVFTLASHLRESLTEFLTKEAAKRDKEDQERRQAEVEAEAEKFRGTAVTVERFTVWRKNYQAERALKLAKEEEERLKLLSNKEREEYRRAKNRPTGRHLFERGGVKEEDLVADGGSEEGEQEVDWSLYPRKEEASEEGAGKTDQ